MAEKKCAVVLCGFEGCTTHRPYSRSCCVCDLVEEKCEACEKEQAARKARHPYKACWHSCMSWKIPRDEQGCCAFCTLDLEHRVSELERRVNLSGCGT